MRDGSLRDLQIFLSGCIVGSEAGSGKEVAGEVNRGMVMKHPAWHIKKLASPEQWEATKRPVTPDSSHPARLSQHFSAEREKKIEISV